MLTELKPEREAKKADARRTWWRQIREWKDEHPFDRPVPTHEIKPQHLMAEIDRISGRQGDRHQRCRPAPDVGRPVHPLR